MASITMSKFSNTTLFSTFFRKIWLTASYKQLSTLIRINYNKFIIIYKNVIKFSAMVQELRHMTDKYSKDILQ